MGETLDWLEASCRDRPMWTHGLRVAGPVRDQTVFFRFDSSTQQFTAHCFLTSSDANVIRALPNHTIADNNFQIPKYKSRHRHIEKGKRLAWKTGYFIPSQYIARPAGTQTFYSQIPAHQRQQACALFFASFGYQINEQNKTVIARFDGMQMRRTADKQWYLIESACKFYNQRKKTLFAHKTRWQESLVNDTYAYQLCEYNGNFSPALYDVLNQHIIHTHHAPLPTHRTLRSERSRLTLTGETAGEIVQQLLAMRFIHAYRQPEPRLGLPQRPTPIITNVKVFHSLTGTAKPTEIMSRIHSIIAAGGLLSAQNRRQRNIVGKTLSPRADAVSGVEYGVAAHVGEDHIGYTALSQVVFVLKPSVLNRQAYWLADIDYGSHSDAYRAYRNYNQQIGHHHLYGEISNDAVRQHLRRIHPRGEDTNEIYFPHEVALEEIEEIQCQAWLYVPIMKALRAIPRNIRPRVRVATPAKPAKLFYKLIADTVND